MNRGSLHRMRAWELSRLLARGEVSSREVVEAFLARIEEAEPEVRAFITLTPDLALSQAARVDEARARGENLHPLAGIPVAVKDVICTDGVRTTCASRILENFVPPYDATVVRRLREVGTPLLGKTNMDEFAMGSSTENSAFHPTMNPWDLERVPGGSSGGSAAAVAAGEAPLALGSDTGGSIRQPAALCGIVGLKPTYGLVSRYGLVAFASSLDQIGPMAGCVMDVALLLSVIAGHDPMDSTSAPLPVPDYLSSLEEGVEGVRFGLVREFMGEGIQRGVRRAVEAAAEGLARAGAQVEEVSLPALEYALPAYYIIAPAEASSNLARYDGVRWGLRAEGSRDVVEMQMRTRAKGFGPEVKRRILLGTFALSAGYYEAWYGQAQRVRTLVAEEFRRAYERVELLLSPTSPTTAFRLGERSEDPLAMYLSDVCTIPSNLAGAPAVSVPCGLAEEDGLPVGLQILGPPFSEPLILRAARAIEDLFPGARPAPLGGGVRPVPLSGGEGV